MTMNDDSDKTFDQLRDDAQVAWSKRGARGSSPREERLLRFFAFDHLPADLRAASMPFAVLALHIAATLPSNAERTVALRKLLEAKDCAVRALLPE